MDTKVKNLRVPSNFIIEVINWKKVTTNLHVRFMHSSRDTLGVYPTSQEHLPSEQKLLSITVSHWSSVRQ